MAKELPRRQFLGLLAAPAVIRVAKLMPVMRVPKWQVMIHTGVAPIGHTFMVHDITLRGGLHGSWKTISRDIQKQCSLIERIA